MLEEDLKVPDELFKDVKFYVVGDIDQKVKVFFFPLSVTVSMLACFQC